MNKHNVTKQEHTQRYREQTAIGEATGRMTEIGKGD